MKKVVFALATLVLTTVFISCKNEVESSALQENPEQESAENAPQDLAIADVKIPEQVEFQNLLPLAKGRKKISKHKEIYGAYLDAQRSITLDNKKLILYPKAKAYRVYDLNQDPLEMNDLAQSSEGKKLAHLLFPQLVALQAKMEDQLDLNNSFPDLSPTVR